MHRIPLRLAAPSITWNRNHPEHILFGKTLNEENIRENTNFILILDDEAEDYARQMREFVKQQLNSLKTFFDASVIRLTEMGMRLLNSIIIRAPRDSETLAKALQYRGNYYFDQCAFEGASRDYEMFLFVQKSSACVDLCEVSGNLMMCFYLMRKYEKSQKYLEDFNKYKAKLSKDTIKKSKIGTLQKLITNFNHEFDDTEDIVPKFHEGSFLCTPCKGFNTSPDLPFTSAACYMSELGAVHTNCDMPSNSIVLVEEPLLRNVATPLVQCDKCFGQAKQVYTCFECHYKTYCSLVCMEKDKAVHEIECPGYKNLLLIIMDANTLFTMFMRTSELLHEHIFKHKSFKKLETAAAVLKKIKVLIAEKDLTDMQYLKFLYTKPNYMKLARSQYSTLVAIALRLTLFIEMKTKAIETYYKRLKLSNLEKRILIGSILMRLDCHLLNNSFDFEVSYPQIVVHPQYRTIEEQFKEVKWPIKAITDRVVNNVEKYYKIDVKKEIVERCGKLLKKGTEANISPASLPIYVHIQPCNRIQRFLPIYKDNIAELYFRPEFGSLMHGEDADRPLNEYAIRKLCLYINEMPEDERQDFVRQFARSFHIHYADYMFEMHQRHGYVKQVTSFLCTTLGKFRHSCVPNVEIIVLRNGIMLGKTLSNVKKGEELFVSYKAHYTRHSHKEREMYLQPFNIDCHCKYCLMPETAEPTDRRLGIYCDSCDGIVITPAQGECSNCHINYMNLHLKYRTEIKILETEIDHALETKAKDRDLYILHDIFLRHAKRYLTPTNEFSIYIHLKHAKFLALRNFSLQSYEIIMSTKENILKAYSEHLIWFTFYSEILRTIKIILYYNIDKNLISVPTVYLRELCKLGLHIVEGQKDLTHLYECFDYQGGLVMQDYGVLLEWKKKILCNDVFPVSNSPKKEDTTKPPPIDVMPTLSKN